jgi:PAS domain S-box-containing protein
MEQNRFYFTRRYVTALTLIALLSVLAFINMSYLINSQANDAKTINISGQQITLSQQIALYAIYYQTKQLEANIESMENNHKFLLSETMSENMKKIYFDEPINLDVRVRTYIQNAKNFRLTTDGKSLTYILQNSQKLLLELNEAAKVYLAETEAKSAYLKNFEIAICIVTLITLILEAFFIFMPANAAINKKTKEILDEKEYSNAVIESSTNAIVSIDERQNVKVYNKKAQDIFGFSKEEMTRSNDLLKIIPKSYLSIHNRGLLPFLMKIFSKLKKRSFEVVLLNKNKEQFSARVSFGMDAKCEVIVINIEDITQEKLKDNILRKQAKFASLGEMIAIIAHQWRQPLTELSLNNMYLKKKIKDANLSEELSKNESIIKFMSENITIFDEFYSNKEGALFEPKEAIFQSLNITENILRLNEIELYLELEKTPSIFGQRNALAQVILSIVQNSIDKHKTQKNALAWIKIVLKERGKHIYLSVEDNAGGISIKPINAIFEPFRTNKKSSSTGLGLYMSKLVVEEKFGGDIKASNTKEGALFEILIPVSLNLIPKLPNAFD